MVVPPGEAVDALSMEVQLYMAPDGEVLCLECNADFVDMLLHVLQAPLGAVMKSCSDEKECPLLGVTSSVPRLRDGVFQGPKEDAIKAIPETMDVAGIIHKTDGVIGGNGFKKTPFCLCCLKYRGQKIACQPGACCPHGAACSCTKSFTKACTSCGKTLDASNAGPGWVRCCGSNFAHWALVASSHWKYCAKCAAEDKGQAQMSTRPLQCASCKASIARTCSSCKWCDVCSAVSLGFDLPGAPASGPQAAPNKAGSIFKDSTKLIVSNSLHIFEASATKVIELVSTKVDGFKSLRICTQMVTENHIKRMVGCSLLGSTQVLTETFGKSTAKRGGELGGGEGACDSSSSKKAR